MGTVLKIGKRPLLFFGTPTWADIELGFKGVELGELIRGYIDGFPDFGGGLSVNRIELHDVGDWMRKELGE